MTKEQKLFKKFRQRNCHLATLKRLLALRYLKMLKKYRERGSSPGHRISQYRAKFISKKIVTRFARRTFFSTL